MEGTDMTKFKKVTSILLSAVILACSLIAAPMSVSAATTNETAVGESYTDRTGKISFEKSTMVVYISHNNGLLQITPESQNVFNKVTFVECNGTTLTNGKDFELKYIDNGVKDGCFTLQITGKGNYTGTYKRKYVGLNRPKLWNCDWNLKYNTEKKMVDLDIRNNGVRLQQPKDFSIGGGPANDNCLVFSMAGAGQYAGYTVSGKIIKEQKSIKGNLLTFKDGQTTNEIDGFRKDIKFVAPNENNRELEIGKDYRVTKVQKKGRNGEIDYASYLAMSRFAGTYIITVEGINSYKDTETYELKVREHVNIAECELTFAENDSTTAVYDANEKEIQLKYNNEILDEDCYTVKSVKLNGKSAEIKNAGDYEVEIEGRENCTGSVVKHLTVSQFVLTKENTIVCSDTVSSIIKVKIGNNTLDLKCLDDFEIKRFSFGNNGHNVSIEGVGNFTGIFTTDDLSRRDTSIDISKYSLTFAENNKSTAEYSGKDIKYQFKDPSGKILNIADLYGNFSVNVTYKDTRKKDAESKALPSMLNSHMYYTKEIGEYTFEIKGKNGNTSSNTFVLNVNPIVLNETNTELVFSKFHAKLISQYGKLRNNLTVFYKANGKKIPLKLNSEYILSFQNNKDSYNVTVDFNGLEGSCYTGFITKNNIPYSERIGLTTNRNAPQYIEIEWDETNTEGEWIDSEGIYSKGLRVYFYSKGTKYLLTRETDYTVSRENGKIKITGKDLFKNTVEFTQSASEYKANEASLCFRWRKAEAGNVLGDNLGFTNSRSLGNDIRNDPAALEKAVKLLEKCKVYDIDTLNANKEKILKTNSNGDGYCDGMSYVTIQRKIGILHDVILDNGEKIELDDTNILTACTVIEKSIMSTPRILLFDPNAANLSENVKIKITENALREKKPVLIVYNALPALDSSKSFNHAVVGYGYEDCSYYSDTTGKTYNHRILICDPNGSALSYVSDEMCLYYNDDGSWVIPYWNVYNNSAADNNSSIGNLYTYN